MMYWKIEPHEDTDYDYCVMPADTEKDHKAALATCSLSFMDYLVLVVI